jgi:hypothetical protein
MDSIFADPAFDSPRQERTNSASPFRLGHRGRACRESARYSWFVPLRNFESRSAFALRHSKFMVRYYAMVDTDFITDFLRDADSPRFSIEEPPQRPALIELLATRKNDEITEAKEPEASCVRTLLLIAAGGIDEAHQIIQELPTTDSAYIHGMIHRIDTDFDNAQYWFRRAGVHPATPEMHRRAVSQSLIGATRSKWDPFWVTDLVEKSEMGARPEQLRSILAIEFDVLLEFMRRMPASCPLNP